MRGRFCDRVMRLGAPGSGFRIGFLCSGGYGSEGGMGCATCATGCATPSGVPDSRYTVLTVAGLCLGECAVSVFPELSMKAQGGARTSGRGGSTGRGRSPGAASAGAKERGAGPTTDVGPQTRPAVRPVRSRRPLCDAGEEGAGECAISATPSRPSSQFVAS